MVLGGQFHNREAAFRSPLLLRAGDNAAFVLFSIATRLVLQELINYFLFLIFLMKGAVAAESV